MIQPPLGKPWLLYIILGSSLALNLVMVLDRPSTDATASEVSAAEVPAACGGSLCGGNRSPGGS
ncbi:MAG: hypothetical protein GXP62_01605 [Oligoflexia bacterium]|nr:hypothetical protein [Oligoflexia bacterium]